jgi:hypothetical protein
MPPYHHQDQNHPASQMEEYVSSGQPDSGDAVVEHSDSQPTASLSLPSVSARFGRSTSSADASYYGGYRTKREMIELEKRKQIGEGDGPLDR